MELNEIEMKEREFGIASIWMSNVTSSSYFFLYELNIAWLLSRLLLIYNYGDALGGIKCQLLSSLLNLEFVAKLARSD